MEYLQFGGFVKAGRTGRQGLKRLEGNCKRVTGVLHEMIQPDQIKSQASSKRECKLTELTACSHCSLVLLGQ